MHKVLLTSATALLLGASMPALADNMGMQSATPKLPAATADYRFELAGAPQSANGKNIVSVRLVHGAKPITGAIIIQSQANMSPIGMAAMTAPIKPLGEQPAGTYRFEVDNGPVWKKPDNWALTFSAKVQGVAQTVTGSVTVKLNP